MANKNHVDFIRRGKKFWNKWRKDVPKILPDLSEADLKRAKLSNANLCRTNFFRARLNKANFWKADLKGAILNQADLRGTLFAEANLNGAHICEVCGDEFTNFREASLIGANIVNSKFDESEFYKAVLLKSSFFKSDLKNANFVQADLRWADLRGANLTNAILTEADLRWANLQGANLRNSVLWKADLRYANLNRADLTHACLSDSRFTKAKFKRANLSKAECECSDFTEVDFTGANLRQVNFNKVTLSKSRLINAKLSEATLKEANLEGADLSGALLEYATIINSNFKKATLRGCYIYGISAWDLNLEDTIQESLFVTQFVYPLQHYITVDNLEIAQFINVLLNNKKIRDAINTITSKVVLILGRFANDRKMVLDVMREELRNYDYVPILIDFQKPNSKDITGTVETMARMARFVIADLTNPSSIPHELATIIPFMRTTPFVPIRLQGSEGYSLFEDLEGAYNWVLPKYEYKDISSLLKSFKSKIIDPANLLADKLLKK
jgi:uncharacterized protein YjbI with pentapeptide repeats